MEKTPVRVTLKIDDRGPVVEVDYVDETGIPDRSTHRISLKSLLKTCENQQLKEIIQKHLYVSPTKKSGPRKNRAKPYIAKYNKKLYLYTVRVCREGKTRSATLFYPDPGTGTIDNIFRFNIDFAKTRNLPLNRYEKEKAQKAHERLCRILGDDYERAYRG